MQDFTFKTSKGSIFESMMKRPSTAKLIKEALSSPIGSTSRMKAKKVFSIMSKLNDKNDGAGGPGGNIFSQLGLNQNNSSSRIEEAPKVPKGIVVFNRIPKARINYSLKPIRKDGAGGPGLLDGRGGYTGSSISDYLSSMGKDSSYSARAALAAKNGITDYAGTADQNTKLLNSLRSGASSDPASLTKTTEPKIYTDIYGNRSFTPPAGLTVPKTDPKIYTDLYGNKSYTQPEKYIPPETKTGWDIAKEAPAKIWNVAKDTWNKVYSNENSSKINELKPLSPVGSSSGVGLAPTQTPNSSTVFTAPKPTSKTNPNIQTDLYGNKSFIEQNNEKITMSADDLKNNSVTEKIPVKITPTKNGAGIHLEVLEGAQGGQCGRFVNNYLGKSIFGDSFEQKMSNANVTEPVAGDVAIFSGGTYGHVAVIESINPDGTLNVVGSNSDGSSEKITRDIVDASKVSGFYRPGAPANLSTPEWLAANAVSENIGPEAFALENNKLLVGQALKDSVWDKYKIAETQSLLLDMQEEGATLPKTVTEFIKASDSAIKDIDKKISSYMKDVMENTDMSDPGNAANAKAQLGYLYTLRGRQNQTYVGYLNDAVEQHQAMLDGMTSKYKLDLENAQLDIANGTADYERTSEALEGMYTALKEAPEAALRMRLMEAQVIKAEYENAQAPFAKDEALSFPAQQKLIQSMGIIVDKDGYSVPDADVSKFIMDNVNDPNSTILPDMALNVYLESVKKTLSAQETENTGPGIVISKEYKEKVAKNAIEQLAAINKSVEGNDEYASLFNSTNDAMMDVANAYGYIYSKNITEDESQKLMDAVETLAPGGGWWRFGTGYGTPPSEEEFVKTVQNKVGETLDDSIAKAIYAVFKAYVADDGGKVTSPEEAVKTFLYPLSSTTNRADTNLEKLTPSEFAVRLGSIIADGFISSVLNY